jgi:leucyl/phenylalanyl-tRNA---protein transferase
MSLRTNRREPKDDFPYLGPGDYFPFPDVDSSTPEGIVGTGGNLSPGMLLSAYSQGIFPWYSENEPILWWSPDPRFVLFPENLHVSESMRRVLRRGEFQVSLDTDFDAVIGNCAASPRPGQDGTWIVPEMVEAYRDLHRLGFAHSVEVRKDGRLVGGLYGIAIGSLFCGESMFSAADNASKAGFIPLVWRLRDEGFTLIDSQVRTEYLASLGAEDIPRSRYLDLMKRAISSPSASTENWGSRFPDFPESTRWRALMERRPIPE